MPREKKKSEELPAEIAAEEDDSQELMVVPDAQNETPENIPTLVPPPADEPTPKPTPKFSLGQILKRLLFFLLRLITVLLILTIIAIGIAYLAPLAYERYVLPVERNSAQVAVLGTQQAQSAAQIASLQAQLATAEAGQAKQGEIITALTGRIQAAEDSIAEHTKKLAALDEMQNTLVAINDTSLAKLDNQIKLLKAMELLSRARLFLYQSNFGLAKQDAQSAREILAGLQDAAPEGLTADLTEANFRLDLVLKNLPDFPVAASDDLDLAWRVLVQGIPHPTPVPTETATPIPTESATPTPVADFTVTPTASTGSVQRPTATP